MTDAALDVGGSPGPVGNPRVRWVLGPATFRLRTAPSARWGGSKRESLSLGSDAPEPTVLLGELSS